MPSCRLAVLTISIQPVIILTDRTAKRSILHRYRLLVGILLAIAALPVCLWLGRIPIAEMAARQACESRELSCRLKIVSLSPGKILARDVRLEAEATEPVAVEEVELGLAWNGLFSPEIRFVRAVKPQLTVDARNGAVKVNILERLNQAGNSSGSSFEVPPFTITDGALIVLTDAGPLRGTVTSSGSIRREVQSRFSLEPAQLVLDAYSLNLEQATGEFVYAEGRLTGDARLNVSGADLEGMSLNALGIEIGLKPAPGPTYELNWTAKVDSVSTDVLEAVSARSEGKMNVEVPDGPVSLETLWITNLEGGLTASQARFAQISAQDASLSVALEQSSEGLKGTVGGRGLMEIKDTLRTERVTLTGDINLADRRFKLSDVTLQGALSLQRAALGEPLMRDIQSGLKLPDPFDQHGDLIATSLGELLTDFSTGLEFEASFEKDSKEIEVTAHGPVALQSDATDASLSWQPSASEPWLSFSDNEVRFLGAAQLVDRTRGLNLKAGLVDVIYEMGYDRLSLSADRVQLVEARVGARRLAADLTHVDYRLNDVLKVLAVDGGFRFSGPAFGMELEALQVQGRIIGNPTSNGWHIGLRKDTCMTVSVISADLPDLKFGPADTEICAADKALFYSDGAALAGRMRPRALEVPIETGFATSVMNLASPELRWRLDDVFSLSLTGSDFDLPFDMIASRDAPAANGEFGAKTMAANLRTSASGLDVDFDFKDSGFTYADVPVRIDIAQLDGHGSIGDDGINIDYSILGARASDGLNPSDDALYEPLMMSGKGMLTSEGATMSGRVRLVDRDAYIGTLDVAHSFDGNRGTAHLHDGELVFVPNGLQLHDLSERMRGLAVNASGVIRPEANIVWEDGELASNGNVTVEGLSFSTFRIGQIKGLSGTFRLDDLIGLHTDGAQTFTLDELRFTPTIVLADGEISLSLPGPDAFYLESAVWPFVMGEISIEPTLWRYDDTEQLITVSAKDWELDRLLGLFQVPDLHVQGRVSGKFPIEIVDANAYFRNARLTSVENGLIRYDSDVSRTAGASDPYAKMAFDALKNFQYKVLSIGANGNLTGNIVIDMALSGNNPEVLQGQAFNLNISLDSDLAKLVHAGSISGSVQAAQDMVVDLVKQQNAAEQND